MTLTPFHLAIPVRDIAEARDFYGGKLGCAEGRSDAHWVDFNLFGHQLVVHLDPALGPEGQVTHINQGVDGEAVPVPHFGVVLTLAQWDQLMKRLVGVIDDFIIEPYTRFEGLPGEQKTMFFQDPSGNALEFKAFKDIQASLFSTSQ
ncbi:MAG: VOC family protein [Pseudomonadaceae bacterium]|nr:VOC family protein [Pseudomonadaceae bacterium]